MPTTAKRTKKVTTTKKKTTRAPSKLKAQKVSYRVTLNIMGKRTIATGPSIVDALSLLKPGIAKGKGILTVDNIATGETKDRVLMPFLVYRAFNMRGLSRDVALQQVASLFPL
jgi:hypothetical protein